MWQNREKLAKIIFIIFAFSLIFSYTCIIVSSEHECIGKDCNICYEINLIRNIFDNLLIWVLLIVLFKAVKNYYGNVRYAKNIIYNLTPVKLKVKILE